MDNFPALNMFDKNPAFHGGQYRESGFICQACQKPGKTLQYGMAE
jgi:hypothetical protein